MITLSLPYSIISIHAPREGGDRICYMSSALREKFQSTPPARGATACIRQQGAHVLISIHAPREGGDTPDRPSPRRSPISIHAPREGGDATGCRPWSDTCISIHAPREGGDCFCLCGQY